MESTTTSTPTALAQAVFYIPSEQNIPERQVYGKNIDTILMYRYVDILLP